VHTATTGFRALDDLRKHRYDIVVYDDSMPDVSVFELHLNIRDLAYNSPRELVATAAKRREHERMTNGSEVHVGTPEDVLNHLVPAVHRVRAHQN
jgi:CheY-like chemotaxis protein